MDAKNQDLLETQFVDGHGLVETLEALASIAAEKAAHVQTNWQDQSLAKDWDNVGHKLANLAHEIRKISIVTFTKE